MKRYNILSILLLFMAGWLVSCYEDKGNYDYDPIATVFLKEKNGGFQDTTIKRGQRLVIQPELKLLVGETNKDTMDFRPEDYTYSWIAYQNNITADFFVLSDTRNLDTAINLPLLTSAYNVIYTVTSKVTRVSSNFKFKLKVETRYSNAWLFLTEDDAGMVDLTLYGKEVGNTSEDPWVFEHGVLARSGFPYRGGGAKFVYYFSPKNYIFIGTGEGSGWLGKNDLSWNDKRMLRYMMTMPESMNYTFEGVVQMGVWHFIGSDGSIYPMGNTYSISTPYNNLPPAFSADGKYKKVKLAPFIGGWTNRNLVFNETDTVMMTYKGGASNTGSYPNIVALPDNLKLKNHKLYFMQGYGTSLTNVYAKNRTNNKYYRYGYDSYASGDPKLGNPLEISNGELLEQATQFVCDNSNGRLYMAIGAKLYVLRGSEFKEVTIIDGDGKISGGFQGFDNICLVTRYTDIQSTRPYIMVATYGGAEGSGKVYYLEPNEIEATELTVRTFYRGLGRVKGISRF